MTDTMPTPTPGPGEPATRVPRFNHVAMSVPADLLDADGRAAILDFWGEVFGCEELPTETEDRRKLVLQAYDWEQFVFLIADDPPMTCPRLDHFGMSVETLEELESFYAKAQAYAEKDDRVDLVEKSMEDHNGVLQLHSFYVAKLNPARHS
jgi:hypothetical protein